MKYTQPIFRPPREAKTILLQVTVGCAHNKCNFCAMYKGVNFSIESLEQIEKDLQEARCLYGDLKRIFLVNGDAFVLSAERLKPIAKLILKYFPNAVIVDAFGQSETAPVTTIKVDGDIDGVQDRCVGTILDGLEMKVVDANNNPVLEGEIGEICYRGTSVMKGYYKDPDKTAQTIDADGFLHSGDLGYIKNGQFFIVDRMKECINTGAEKVYPIEVEEVLIDHPKIDQVCVIGVADEEWGEIVRAVVILKEGETMTQEEVIQFVEGKIAGFKKPRSVLFVKEFPISPVGKVLRSKIREQFGKPTN